MVTLDYEQVIKQVAVVDEPASTVTGAPGAAIHHEPGLFLNMLDEIPDGFDIARLGHHPPRGRGTGARPRHLLVRQRRRRRLRDR